MESLPLYYEEADIAQRYYRTEAGGMLGHKTGHGFYRFGRKEMVLQQAAHGNYLQFEFRQSVGDGLVASASQRPGREYQTGQSASPGTHLSGATGF
jgi:hypothetical protein